MSQRRRQTSLPADMTRQPRDAGYAQGFSENSYYPSIPEAPRNEPARTVDTRQHRFSSPTVTVGTTSEVIAGYNENRRFLGIQNNSAVVVFVAFGCPASVTGDSSFQIAANGGYLSFENGICPNNEIYAVASASAQICILEGSAI